MNRLISYIIGSVLLLSTVPASAATLRGNTLTPDGFCTVHQDKTRGVRFSGESYTAWLAVYAMTAERLEEAVKSDRGMKSEVEIGQLKARLLKAAAELQRLRIDQGQIALCK